MSGNSGNEDSNWIIKIKRGDKKAFEEMFLRYYQPLCNFAWRFTKSNYISEELVQDVFLSIWVSRENLDPNKNIKSYLYRSVKNRALNHIEHQEVADNYNEEILWLDYSPIHQTHTFDKESAFIREAKNAVEDLPEEIKIIYKLSRKDGLTYKEIAEVMEISPKTVESKMSKALKILRRSLSEYLTVVAALLSKIV